MFVVRNWLFFLSILSIGCTSAFQTPTFLVLQEDVPPIPTPGSGDKSVDLEKTGAPIEVNIDDSEYFILAKLPSGNYLVRMLAVNEWCDYATFNPQTKELIKYIHTVCHHSYLSATNPSSYLFDSEEPHKVYINREGLLYKTNTIVSKGSFDFDTLTYKDEPFMGQFEWINSIRRQGNNKYFVRGSHPINPSAGGLKRYLINRDGTGAISLDGSADCSTNCLGNDIYGPNGFVYLDFTGTFPNYTFYNRYIKYDGTGQIDIQSYASAYANNSRSMSPSGDFIISLSPSGDFVRSDTAGNIDAIDSNVLFYKIQGRDVIYLKDNSSVYEIYHYDIETNNKTFLSNKFASSVSDKKKTIDFSAAHKKLIFTAYDAFGEGKTTIAIIDFDGTNLKKIVEIPNDQALIYLCENGRGVVASIANVGTGSKGYFYFIKPDSQILTPVFANGFSSSTLLNVYPHGEGRFFVLTASAFVLTASADEVGYWLISQENQNPIELNSNISESFVEGDQVLFSTVNNRDTLWQVDSADMNLSKYGSFQGYTRKLKNLYLSPSGRYGIFVDDKATVIDFQTDQLTILDFDSFKIAKTEKILNTLNNESLLLFLGSSPTAGYQLRSLNMENPLQPTFIDSQINGANDYLVSSDGSGLLYQLDTLKKNAVRHFSFTTKKIKTVYYPNPFSIKIKIVSSGFAIMDSFSSPAIVFSSSGDLLYNLPLGARDGFSSYRYNSFSELNDYIVSTDRNRKLFSQKKSDNSQIDLFQFQSARFPIGAITVGVDFNENKIFYLGDGTNGGVSLVATDPTNSSPVTIYDPPVGHLGVSFLEIDTERKRLLVSYDRDVAGLYQKFELDYDFTNEVKIPNIDLKLKKTSYQLYESEEAPNSYVMFRSLLTWQDPKSVFTSRFSLPSVQPHPTDPTKSSMVTINSNALSDIYIYDQTSSKYVKKSVEFDTSIEPVLSIPKGSGNEISLIGVKNSKLYIFEAK